MCVQVIPTALGSAEVNTVSAALMLVGVGVCKHGVYGFGGVC
jgi:hypothetical protein